MEAIQPQAGTQRPANSPNEDDGDDGDIHDRFWTQLKARYIGNTDDDVLSAIVENMKEINQYLLLKQHEKVTWTDQSVLPQSCRRQQ